MSRGLREAASLNSENASEADKISAVQYLKWPLGGHPPLAVGCDLPELTAETVLDAEQRAALLADMSG